jgi:hypothetical protein
MAEPASPASLRDSAASILASSIVPVSSDMALSTVTFSSSGARAVAGAAGATAGGGQDSRLARSLGRRHVSLQ